MNFSRKSAFLLMLVLLFSFVLALLWNWRLVERRSTDSRNIELKRILIHEPDRWNERRTNEPDLAGIQITGAHFAGLDLSGVDLSAAYFREVVFTDCTLYRTILNNSVLERVRFENSNLDSVFIVSARMTRTTFIDSSMVNVVIDGSSLDSVVFERINFQNTTLGQIKAHDVEIRESDLQFASFVIPVSLKNFRIVRSNLNHFKYRFYEDGMDISIIESEPCTGALMQYCK